MTDTTLPDMPPGWTRRLQLNVDCSPSGLVMVSAVEPRGLLVAGHTLAEALSHVPVAIREFREVGEPVSCVGDLPLG